MCVWCLFLAWENRAGGSQKVLVRRKVSKWEELILWKTKNTHISCERVEGIRVCHVFRQTLRTFLLGKETLVVGEYECTLGSRSGRYTGEQL